jgi:hypothetical protein
MMPSDMNPMHRQQRGIALNDRLTVVRACRKVRPGSAGSSPYVVPQFTATSCDSARSGEFQPLAASRPGDIPAAGAGD